ncbi:MAG: hypothetical protein GY941_23110 [Planctomycetes bacterium]|nr:hypothetical protein [Planctomycetota bacterium]
MKSKNTIVNFFLAVAFLFVILQAGCSTAVKKQTLSSIEPGIGLSEISDPNQFPDFKDDYGKTMLLYAIDNSKLYLNKVHSYPDTFKSMGFTPATQKETLDFFRDGYLRCKNSGELNEFITGNFRIFQVVGNESQGDVHFAGYGTPTNDASVTEKWTYAISNGSLGVRLSSMRSIATGKGLFPSGGLAFAVIENGGTGGTGQKALSGKSFFVLNQDIGSSINTPDRADIFFGVGDDAVLNAASLSADGKLYYLLKR